MLKIYRAFNLTSEFKDWFLKLNSLKVNKTKPKNLISITEIPNAIKTLRHGLLNKGYTILESNESFGGLPGTIILGGEIEELHHEDDFYAFAEKLKLPYQSGNFYTEVQLGFSRSEQVFQSEKPEVTSLGSFRDRGSQLSCGSSASGIWRCP